MLVGSHLYPHQDSVLYGRPAAEAIDEAARNLGARRLLIVTTRSLAGPGGLAAALAHELGRLVVGTYAGVSAHSPRPCAIEGAAEARRLDADLLIALGGSSVIDATKLIQLCLWETLTEAADLDPYRVRPGPPKVDLDAIAPGVRMVAVPTTLSAAEFTPFAGALNPLRKAKERFTHKDLAPRVVVLDPAMTLSTPRELWLSSGMKAVDHAVEQLCHAHRAPFGDALAADGLQLLARALPASVEGPAEFAARQDCQFGMWLAISGSSSGRGSGPSHAIGHSLGGSYGVPHGITSCVSLWAVLKWCEGMDPERQALVAALMGRPDTPASDAVADLVRSLGLPTTLQEIRVGPDQFQAIAEHTMHDAGIRGSPRPIREAADIVEILEIAA